MKIKAIKKILWTIFTCFICLSSGLLMANDVAFSQQLKNGQTIIHCQANPYRANLCIENNKEVTNLSKLKPFSRILETLVSESEDYLALWYHLERPPLIIDIYSLKNNERLARFSPGLGGALIWLKNNKLIHIYGGGTGVQGYNIYDTQGRDKTDSFNDFYGLNEAAWFVDVSPEGRYVAFIPANMSSVGQQAMVKVVDTVLSKQVHINFSEDSCLFEDIRWQGTKVYIDFNCENSNEQYTETVSG